MLRAKGTGALHLTCSRRYYKVIHPARPFSVSPPDWKNWVDVVARSVIVFLLSRRKSPTAGIWKGILFWHAEMPRCNAIADPVGNHHVCCHLLCPSVSGAPICKHGCFCGASWTNHVGLECWHMPSSLYLTCTCTPQDAAEFLWRLPHYHLPETSPCAASLCSRSKLLAGG